MSDPYDVLGLPRHAGEEEIRESPPDRDPERFTAVRAAYDAVRDPVRRLEAQLFELDSSDTLDTFISDVRARLFRHRIPQPRSRRSCFSKRHSRLE